MAQGKFLVPLKGITEVHGVLEEHSLKEQLRFQKENMAKRSCQVGSITESKTIRQEVRGLFSGHNIRNK